MLGLVSLEKLRAVPEAHSLDALIETLFDVFKNDLRAKTTDIFFRQKENGLLHCWYRQTQGRTHEESVRLAAAAYENEAVASKDNMFAFMLKSRGEKFGAIVFSGKPPKRVEELCMVVDYAASILYSSKLHFIANKDKLTNLYTRGFIYKTLGEWKERHAPFGVILFDIDRFKHYNDRYGHPVGDHVLRTLASAIRAKAKSLLVGRYGGEEFLIGVERADDETLLAIMEQFRLLVKNIDFSTADYALRVTISLGASRNPVERTLDYDIDEIIREADTALYQSKRNGRNRSTLYKKDS